MLSNCFLVRCASGFNLFYFYFVKLAKAQNDQHRFGKTPAE